SLRKIIRRGSVPGGLMSRQRLAVETFAAFLAGAALLALLMPRAGAQYYCDERYPASCQGYEEYPPPFPFFPFAPSRPRQYAPQPYEPQPYDRGPPGRGG